MMQARIGDDMVVRLADGEDFAAALAAVPIDSGVIVGGIGMLKNVRLGYWNGHSYEEHCINEPGELLSAQGTLAAGPEGRAVHCHVSIARRDGTVCGGHLIAAEASTTTEIVLRVFRGIRLVRRPDPNGLLGLYPELSD